MSDKKHAHVISELYAHPIAHNMKWAELIPALSAIGFVHTEENGGHHFARNGHTVVFVASNRDTLDEDEIMKLRHFMQSSAASKNKNPSLTRDAVVAISYHQAVVFHDPGMASEHRTEERADLTKNNSRVLHKRPTSPPYSNTGPVVDDVYYDSVIKEISEAERIVILSHGTGSSNAASRLMSRIKEKRPELAHRVAAFQRCDLEAMTEPQILSLGKKLLNPAAR